MLLDVQSAVLTLLAWQQISISCRGGGSNPLDSGLLGSGLLGSCPLGENLFVRFRLSFSLETQSKIVAQ